jgi:hypothetical protein
MKMHERRGAEREYTCNVRGEVFRNIFPFQVHQRDVHIMVLFNFLDDDEFVQLITGGKPVNFATIIASLNTAFWLRCAEYISFCMQNSLFERFSLTVVDIVNFLIFYLYN